MAVLREELHRVLTSAYPCPSNTSGGDELPQLELTTTSPEVPRHGDPRGSGGNSTARQAVWPPFILQADVQVLVGPRHPDLRCALSQVSSFANLQDSGEASPIQRTRARLSWRLLAMGSRVLFFERELHEGRVAVTANQLAGSLLSREDGGYFINDRPQDSARG